MSTRLGEWFADPRVGTRCAEFHRTITDPRTLGATFELELARLAFVASDDTIRLPFIDRVVAIDVPSVELFDGALHTTAMLVLSGHGEWRGPLRVFVAREGRP